MMRILCREVVGKGTVYYWYRAALADHFDGITVDAIGKYEILRSCRLVCAERLADPLEIDCVAIIWIDTSHIQPYARKDVSVTIVRFEHRIRIVSSITVAAEIPDIGLRIDDWR